MSNKAQIISKLQQGEVMAAVSLARDDVNARPADAEGHYLLARALAEAGNVSAALSAAERACALAPKNFNFLYYCGQLFGYYDLYELALPYFQRSVNIEPRAPMSQYYLGKCYFELGNSNRAVPHYREAMRLAPNDSNKERVRIHLAKALLTSNKESEALKLLDRLAWSSGTYQVEAICLMAGTAKQMPDGAIGKKLLALLDEPGLDNDKLRRIHMSLGKLQANAGNLDAAFASWTTAAAHAKADDWHLRDHAEILSDHKIFYTRDLFEKCTPYGNESNAPVFIVGMPRSGTTLTEQILASHSKSVGVGELVRWITMNTEFMRENARPLNHAGIVEKAKNGELRRRGLEDLALMKSVSGELKDRVIEKTPHNFMSLGYPALVFPNARFIHIRRHPADAFLSAFQNELNKSHGYSFDQTEYAKEYLFQEAMMDYWKSILPGRIKTINYENLASDPETHARELIAFIGLEWEPQCLTFFERESTVKTLSLRQVRQPVHTGSVEKWRRYEKHLGPLFAALKDANFTYQ